MKFLLLFLLFFPLKANEWTTQQIVLESSYDLILLADWRQTSNFHQTWCNKKPVYECNPLLDKFPSQKSINEACIASAISHLIISNYLGDNRISWQAVTLSIEFCFVAHNQTKLEIALKW